ncbi:Lrp/AsnC family transcriptional regulator [Crocinitomix catalasitica]|uniref:Lrp/AsnC family transcriptional regulator n=1 Tax=Crocinitomix catalasitica TaxID=184607 RepID=UPI0004869D6F|nr:Lrp/AsnC family transcriptional regulator [Crocinitomix catalasitica]
MALDNIDKQLLRFLQQDSSMTIKQLAFELKLTTTPVYERIKRLEKSGIIEGYRATINPAKVGLELSVLIHISLKEHAKALLVNFEKQINLLDEVTECYHVTGEHDYLLKAYIPNMEGYRDFLTNKLAKIPNIVNVHSSFVVSQIKQGGILESV